MRKNEKGFGLVEVAVVIAIVGLTVAVVWLFLDRQNSKTTDTTGDTQTSNSNKSSDDESQIDPTADWQVYNSPSGKYTVKFPQTWVTAENPEYCTEGLLLLGVKMDGNQSSVGKCAADGARAFGHMAISEQTAEPDMSKCGYSDEYWKTDSTESVKVSGVTAIKTSATYIGDEEEMGGQPKGNQAVQYCFLAKDTLFITSYVKWAEYPDVLNDYNTMLTKTFVIK